MFRPQPLLFALSMTLLALEGCHKPEIYIVNRADASQGISTPFEYHHPLNFPKIETGGKPYWVVFVDQTPCTPTDGTNPKALHGTPDHPPTCLIEFHPAGRDREYRYALFVEEESHADKATPPPPVEIPYRASPCQPICN